MSNITQVDDKTIRWNFIFSYLIEETDAGYSASCEFDDASLGTLDTDRAALEAASDDCTNRIKVLHNCLLTVEGSGRSLCALLGGEQATSVLDDQTKDRASELIKGWRERPQVPYASPISVAHMDDPAEFRREQDVASGRYRDWSATWVPQVDAFLAEVEEKTSCGRLGWKAPLFDVEIPEFDKSIARWNRVRLVLEIDRRIVYYRDHEEDGDKVEQWVGLLENVVGRDATWWAEQCEVRRPGRLPAAHQGGLS